MNFYMEDGDFDIINMFSRHGFKHTSRHKADLIVFGGGADVSPALYGEENTASHTRHERDLDCVYLYNYARLNHISCVGICRGGQFLNVMNGGAMIQHVPGHGVPHRMKTALDGVIPVTSGHHQVMVPSPRAFIDGWHEEDKSMIESLVYTRQDGKSDICYQPHPEWCDSDDHPCCTHFFNLIETYVKGK